MRWRDWVPPQPVSRLAGIMREREQQEWGLADQIVTDSDFVASGLNWCGISREESSRDSIWNRSKAFLLTA